MRRRARLHSRVVFATSPGIAALTTIACWVSGYHVAAVCCFVGLLSMLDQRYLRHKDPP